MRVVRLTGDELLKALPELARLRIEVFHDFPYLYDGSLLYEEDYLRVYAKSPQAAVIAAYDEDRLVGAASAIPLSQENDYIQKPFLDKKMDVTQIFYFGESVLKKEYRGRGVGHRFFDEREKVALEAKCKITTFCVVDRDLSHPLKPADYRPLDEFWKKRGYRQEPQLKATFLWKDLDENQESPKSMVYWLKEWT